jgi:hypothetical protein
MDLEGLKQYFVIGSDEKVVHSRSPRIGQFGIGKFASLAAAARFAVITQNKGFAARVVFRIGISFLRLHQIPCNFPPIPPDNMLRKGYHIQNSEVNDSGSIIIHPKPLNP